MLMLQDGILLSDRNQRTTHSEFHLQKYFINFKKIFLVPLLYYTAVCMHFIFVCTEFGTIVIIITFITVQAK